jgi:alkylation response protein AidB-like acyl-CoA dehydrogenase
MSLILARCTDPARQPFGKSLKHHDLFLAQLAGLRMEIESARLLVLNAADMIDRVGAKGALRNIAMAKVLVSIKSVDHRLSCRKSLDVYWIGLFKFLALKECVKINC